MSETKLSVRFSSRYGMLRTYPQVMEECISLSVRFSSRYGMLHHWTLTLHDMHSSFSPLFIAVWNVTDLA